METQHPILNLSSTLEALPKATSQDIRAQVQSQLHSPNAKVPLLIALDDDPTGTQTCHDVTVLTVWDVATLTTEFKRTRPGSGFFILTNSRAFHPEPARELIREICTNLKAAEEATGTPFEVVLRGDSTLRGHFPLEAEAATDVLGEADAWLLCPFFLQGGRYTIDDVHYVAEGADSLVLVPAAQTPFAKDATFGYKSSNLRDYVVEKTKGAIPREHITSITLSTIRNGGPDAVLQQLLSHPPPPSGGARPVVIVNAAAESDVDVVVAALLMAASAHGKRYLYRTGAAFVSARLGIKPIPPISASQLNLSTPSTSQEEEEEEEEDTATTNGEKTGEEIGKRGGLIIAGSYVPKTTTQLAYLRSQTPTESLTSIIIDVRKLLSSKESSAQEMARAKATAEEEITRGRDVLVMTSRELITGDSEAASLDIGSVVAAALVSFLRGLRTKPRYVIAKGGITSSDMATKGLGMRRALVVGQAAPGVPLWRCEEKGSKWPGLPFVVFPGNVGGEETLYEVVKGWSR